jgi:hypothetical protein
MIPDSVKISPLREIDGTRPRGLIARYSAVRGVSKSTVSSLKGILSSWRAICARWAPGRVNAEV